jgi:peptide chain release factor 2
VTVVAIDSDAKSASGIDRSKVRVDTYRGSGPGGQHRNKTDSAVRLTYGNIVVTAEEDRSQHKNKAVAWKRLEERVREVHESELCAAQNESKAQYFSGERDYSWTSWRDEVSGPFGKMSMKKALKGRLDPILK